MVNRRSRRSGVAVDPADGDTVWRVDGAVTSWFASGDTMVVFNGSTMSLLSFDSGSEPAGALPLGPGSESPHMKAFFFQSGS